MNKKNLSTDDALGGIRKKVGELQEEIKSIKTILEEPSIWGRVWQERNWSFWLITFILGVIGTAIWYVGGLILDKHIQSGVTVANGPLQTDIRRVDGDVQQIKATVSLLQTQIAAQRYSAVPVKDLKSHREELTDLRKTLAQPPPGTPGYWPVSFQIITLNSQATSDVEKAAKQNELVLDNVGGASGSIRMENINARVFLENRIEGAVFKNSIIRFDPSVRLVNVVFINCVFIFPLTQSPPTPLQEIGKTLLASDLSNVTINAS